MTRRVWVVGPIAWDSVIYIDEFPNAGGFAQSNSSIERAGGTAGNVAIALATTGIETGFISYIGKDEYGSQLHDLLKASRIKNLHLKVVEGPTSHVLVVIDNKGERSIFGLNESFLSQISILDLDLKKDDVVCFVLWRDYFIKDLEYAQSKGCITVVDLGALTDPRVSKVNVAIGFMKELDSNSKMSQYLERFEKIVVTRGELGAIQFDKNGTIHQPSFPAETIDTTGAGDSFLAGYLAALACGDIDGRKGLEAGARWAALMVSLKNSVPPNWEDVPNSYGLLNI